MSTTSDKKFSFVMMGRIFYAVASALFYLIFAYLLDPESYGNLSYVIALAGTFSIISRFGLNQSVTIFLAKEKNDLVNSINILAICSVSVASITLLAFDIYAAIICLGTSLFVMNFHNFIGLREYKKYFRLQLIIGFLIILIPISLYFSFDLYGLLFGFAISHLLCGFNFLKNINIKKNFLKNISSNSKILIHNFGVDFSTYAPRFIDKLIIFPFFGFSNLGIHQLNIQILFALEILPLALHSFLLSEESRGKKYFKTNYLILLTSIFITILAILIGPIFINQFFPQYSLGIESFQIMIISIIPLTIGYILTAKLQANESTLVGYSAVVRIGSMVVLIPILGSMFELIGISLSILFSAVLYAISLFIIHKISVTVSKK